LVEDRGDPTKLGISTAIAAQIGEAQIVGNDEDDIGALGCGGAHVLIPLTYLLM
jgi:hypothetical protein